MAIALGHSYRIKGFNNFSTTILLSLFFFYFNDDIMQLLEATPDNSISSDLPISLPANNNPEQREKLAVLVSKGKFKEATGSQLNNRRNPFKTKMWRNIMNCMRPTTWRKTTKTLITISFLMLGRKAIGMFVKVDGVEALQKDMREEFIINSVLSWKLCNRTYNKQLDFFIINSAFPSLTVITALRSGRLLVVANAALTLQPNTLFFFKKQKTKKQKKLKKQPAKKPGQ